MEEKELRVNAGKTKIMICGMGLDIQQSSGWVSGGVGSKSIFWNDCKHWVHNKCSGLKPLTKDPDYRCTWCLRTACLGWQTTEGSPSKIWQDGGGSFLVLPRRHAFSSRWLWTFNHNMCENLLEEAACYQVSPPATSLSRHMAMCTALVRSPMFHASETWLLTKPNIQRLQWDHRAIRSDWLTMSSHKILSSPDAMSYLHGLTMRIWTLFWRREGSTGIDTWDAPIVQSRQPLTFRLMESVGLRGPRWHGSSWQRRIAENGSSWL